MERLVCVEVNCRRGKGQQGVESTTLAWVFSLWWAGVKWTQNSVFIFWSFFMKTYKLLPLLALLAASAQAQNREVIVI